MKLKVVGNPAPKYVPKSNRNNERTFKIAILTVKIEASEFFLAKLKPQTDGFIDIGASRNLSIRYLVIGVNREEIFRFTFLQNPMVPATKNGDVFRSNAAREFLGGAIAIISNLEGKCWADPRPEPPREVGIWGGGICSYIVQGNLHVLYRKIGPDLRLSNFTGDIDSGVNGASCFVQSSFNPSKTYSSYPKRTKGRASHYKGPYRHVALGAQILLGAVIFAFGLFYQDHALRKADTLKTSASGVYAGCGAFLIVAAFVIIGHGVWAFTA